MSRLTALATLLALLPLQANAEGWTLHKRPAAGPGAGQCAIQSRGENRSLIELSIRDAARRKYDFRLALFMETGARNTIPHADGEIFLSFASSGQKSTPITGRLRTSGETGIFLHDFASLDEMRHFVTEIARGPTLFVAGPNATPHTDLLARFTLSDSDKAMNWLLSCNFMP
ncbi:MAG: hypothetical protein JXQ91_02730 [Vannielia sp.]|uniref:hypothetical protein n=1 Tax=Vannielia sp. TaxID=2813045 RepID=UPI003B8C770A